jgi:bifunctional DNase/RNase
MNKIELEIVALSHSITNTHSYAVVLGEVNGTRRIPIVIGGFEAQAIAVVLEHIQPSRPLTHDLMKNFMLAFEIELQEIIISDLQEGIFYSKLICNAANDTIEIDSRTSDALALAVRFGCPIYTYNHIVEEASLQIEGTSASAAAGTGKKKKGKEKEPEPVTISEGGDDYRTMSIEQLQQLLEEMVAVEDYITAAAIRNEINSRKSGR